MTDHDNTIAPDEQDRDIDALGRRAGAVLRRPAPSTGAIAVMSAGRAVRRRRVAGAVVGASAIVAAATAFVTAGDGPTVVTDAPSTSATTNTTPELSTSAPSPSLAAATDPAWLRSFLGEPVVGRSDGAPVRIGVAWSGSSSFDPEAVQLVADFVNDEAGGAGGRPIEIIECAAPGSSLDRCVDEFAGDGSIGVVLVATGGEHLEFIDFVNGIDDDLTVVPVDASFDEAFETAAGTLAFDETQVVQFQPTTVDLLVAAGSLAAERTPLDRSIAVIPCTCVASARWVGQGAGARDVTELPMGSRPELEIAAALAADPSIATLIVDAAGEQCAEVSAAARTARPDILLVTTRCDPGLGGLVVGVDRSPDDGARATIESVLDNAGWDAPGLPMVDDSWRTAAWPSDLLTIVRIASELPDEPTRASFRSAIASYVGPSPLGDLDCLAARSRKVELVRSCVASVQVSSVAEGGLVPESAVAVI